MTEKKYYWKENKTASLNFLILVPILLLMLALFSFLQIPHIEVVYSFRDMDDDGEWDIVKVFYETKSKKILEVYYLNLNESLLSGSWKDVEGFHLIWILNEEGNPNAGGYWAIDNDRDGIFEKRAPENLIDASNLNMKNKIFILNEKLWWLWIIIFLALSIHHYRMLNYPFIRITEDLFVFSHESWILNWSEILKIKILEKKRDVTLNIIFKRKNKQINYKTSVHNLENLEDLFETLKLKAEKFGFDIEKKLLDMKS